jgi:hypothetical protein
MAKLTREALRRMIVEAINPDDEEALMDAFAFIYDAEDIVADIRKLDVAPREFAAFKKAISAAAKAAVAVDKKIAGDS